MSLYDLSVPQLKRMLTNLDRWLRAGIALAEAKRFDPAVLLGARLAPDQFPLLKQVQSACDHAKFAAARLTAKDPPKHPDTEQTVDEILARIQTVVAYLNSFEAADFHGAEDRMVVIGALPPGKGMRGTEYLSEFALPNFYFHVTTAYAILRHNGVQLGKLDYMGNITLRDV
jgi:hypothetical protein